MLTLSYKDIDMLRGFTWILVSGYDRRRHDLQVAMYTWWLMISNQRSLVVDLFV